MASGDEPIIPRKKATTYGKTSRKRPIHAFLELSNGSRRTGDDGQDTSGKPTSTIQTQDPYDPPPYEPEHTIIPQKDAPLGHAISATQSEGSGSSKKRKLSTALATQVDRRLDSKPTTIAQQSTVPPHVRRPKSTHVVRSAGSTRVAKHESNTSALAPDTSRSPRHTGPPRSKHSVPTGGSILQMTEGRFRMHPGSTRLPKPEVKTSQSSTLATKSSATKPRNLPAQSRRLRLIDQLAAQNEDSSGSESDVSEPSAKDDSKRVMTESPFPILATSSDITPKLSASSMQLSNNRKLRSTYGQQRTLRADEPGVDVLGSQIGTDRSQNDLSPPPVLSKFTSFSYEEEEIEEEMSAKGGIIDIHALRQAGANHRFADSLADLLDRAGTPQSPRSQSARSRRTALLELASKFRDKTFVRQFRDQGAKDALFQSIGAEEDVVSGFALLSVLLALFTSYSLPHLVPQLQAEGIAQLASRMFDLDDDIAIIAGQRKLCLSKHGQMSLNALKSTLQQLDIWKGSSPPIMSPQILALKVLSVLCKKNDSPATRDMLASLTDKLFSFVDKGWEKSRAEGMEGTEGGIAMSLLEGYSISAMQSEAGPRWTKHYLPIFADILTAAMARPMEQFGEFESTMLKLALNTTNNNPTAAGVFSRGELFRELAETSLAAFELLQRSVRNGAFSKEVYETLMLILGVMINTSEHCPSTRQSVDAWQGHDGSPLDKLMDVYLDNRESAGAADSVEKTSVAVAHGYLAILLGYLSLGARVRRRLKEKGHGRGVKYLLDSIQEFMTLHAKVTTDESTTSLQNLVSELRHTHQL